MKKYIVPTIYVLDNDVEPACLVNLSDAPGQRGDFVNSKQSDGNTFNFVGGMDDDK